MKKFIVSLMMVLFSLATYSCRETSEENRESSAEEVERQRMEDDNQHQRETEEANPAREVEEDTEEGVDGY